MFKTTQIGWPVLFIVIGILTVLGFTIEPIGFRISGVICLIIILLTYRLTVSIDQNWVRFTMGVGLIRGKFALGNIVDCKPVDYIPLGWGVRFRPGRIIYNVTGTKAIELTLSGKSMKVWIGTDDPETLVRVIREFKRKNSV